MGKLFMNSVLGTDPHRRLIIALKKMQHGKRQSEGERLIRKISKRRGGQSRREKESDSVRRAMERGGRREEEEERKEKPAIDFRTLLKLQEKKTE